MQIGKQIAGRLGEWFGRAKATGGGGAGGGAALGDVLAAVAGVDIGAVRGTREILTLYRSHPWLRTFTHRYATGIASVRWRVYAYKPKRAKRAVRHFELQRASFMERRAMEAELAASGELVELPDHPLLTLMRRGCPPYLKGHGVWQIAQSHLDMVGEAFVWMPPDAFGLPGAMVPFPPNQVTDRPTPGDADTYTVTMQGRRKTIAARDMLWIKDPDPADPLGAGVGLGHSLGDELDLGSYLLKWAKAFFENGALPDTWVGFEGYSAEEVKAIKRDYLNRFRGPHRAHQVEMVNAIPHVVRAGSNLRENQTTDLRDSHRDTMQQGYALPPELAGILESSNKATIDSAGMFFALWGLVPRADRIRDSIQEDVAPRYDDRLVVSYYSPVPEDREAQAKAAAVAPWALTRNEWRGKAGAAAREDGDVYVMPANLTAIDAGGLEGAGGARALPRPRAPRRTGGGGGTRGTVESEDVDRVLSSLVPERLQYEINPLWRAELEQWGAGVLGSLGVEPAFDIANPKVLEHLEHLSSTKITRINDVTKARVREVLLEGVHEGEDVRRLAKRVRGVMGECSKYRSILIARTEVVGSSNFGTYQAHSISGIVERRQFVSTPDDRTRDEHWEINGQIRGIRDPFEITGPAGSLHVGDKGLHPGAFGHKAMNIACRCTTIALFESRGRLLLVGPGIRMVLGVAELRAVWESYAEAIRPWERKAVAAVRRGFRAQEADLLERLQQVAG